MIDKSLIRMYSLDTFLSEYKILNLNNQYRPVAVGRYGIRTRESIYSKELAKDYSKNKLIFKGTLTVGMGSNQMDIGILSDDEVYSVSPAYHTYRITNINYDYLRYCLQCRNKDMFIRFMKRGSRQGKSIDLKRWIKYKIPVYPSKIQLDIVKRLNLVQSIILERKKELDNLEMFVKARFSELFGDPVANDKNWPVVTISDIAEVKIGPFGTLLHKEDYIEGGHALVNPSQIKDGKIVIDSHLTISDEKYHELSAYHLQIGDIVFGRRGEMGRCAVVKESGLLCGTGSLIVRPSSKIKPYFLQNILSSPGYKKIIEEKAVGITMLNVNVPIVSALNIPLLPINLQNQFIQFMSQVVKSKFAISKYL